MDLVDESLIHNACLCWKREVLRTYIALQSTHIGSVASKADSESSRRDRVLSKTTTRMLGIFGYGRAPHAQTHACRPHCDTYPAHENHTSWATLHRPAPTYARRSSSVAQHGFGYRSKKVHANHAYVVSITQRRTNSRTRIMYLLRMCSGSRAGTERAGHKGLSRGRPEDTWGRGPAAPVGLEGIPHHMRLVYRGFRGEAGSRSQEQGQARGDSRRGSRGEARRRGPGRLYYVSEG